MSYDISLCDPVTKETLRLDHKHQIRGGTYCVGGTEELQFNITYNYAQIFQRVLGKNAIRSIYGMTGSDSIKVLKEAIEKLKDDVDENYWNPTEGNAKEALKNLVLLAEMRPDGVWKGD